MREGQYERAIDALEGFRKTPYRFSPFVSGKLEEKMKSVRAAWDLEVRTSQTRLDVRREKLLEDLTLRLETIRKEMEEGDWGRAHRECTDFLAFARKERGQEYVQSDRGCLGRVEKRVQEGEKAEERIWAIVDSVRTRKRQADTLVKGGKYREGARVYDELIREYPRYVLKEEVEFPVRIRVRPEGTRITGDRRGDLGSAKEGGLTIPFRYKESLQVRLSLKGYRTQGPFRLDYLDGESPEYVMEEKAALSPAWPWAPFERPVEWSPVYAGGLVFVAAGRTLYGIRTSEPAMLDWQSAQSKPISGAPVERGGKIFFGTGERALHVVDPLQRKDLRIPVAKEVIGSPGVSSEGRFAAVVTSDRFLAYLDVQAASGRETLWERPMPVDLEGQPAVKEGVVYVLGKNATLYAVRGPDESDLLWSYSAGMVLSPPTTAGDRVFLGREDGKVVALDREGKEVWSADARGPIVAPPTVEGEEVYAVTLTGNLLVSSTREGPSWLWPSEEKPVKPIRASARVVGERILVPAEDRLYVLERKTGKLRWWFAPAEGGKFVSAPLIVGNVVYLGATDKSLYAVELD